MFQNEFASAVLLMVLIASALPPTIAPYNVYGQEDMSPKQTFETQESYIRLALSADGKYIAAISRETHRLSMFNRTHIVWNTSVPGVGSIVMSEDAGAIVAGANTGLYIFTIQNSTSRIHYNLRCEKPLVAVSDDGNTIACAVSSIDQSDDPVTMLYMLESPCQSPTWNTTLQGTLESVSVSSNGNYTTISTSNPGTLHLFSRENPTPLWTYNLGERGGAARISNDGNYIVVTGGNVTGEHGLRIYRFGRQSPLPNYVKVISELPSKTGLSVASQGTMFTLSLAESKRLLFFNLDLPPYGYGPGSVLNISLPSQPLSLSMSAEGGYTAIGTDTGVYIYEYVNKQLSLTKQYTFSQTVIVDLDMTPDGRFLAASVANQPNNGQSTIYLFDIRNSDLNVWFRIAVAIVIIVVALTALAYLRRRNQRARR